MNDELMRRISDALSRPGGLASDPELAGAISEDPAAQAYVADSLAMAESLKALGETRSRVLTQIDWDAQANAIEARIAANDLPHEDSFDYTAPPPLASEPHASDKRGHTSSSEGDPPAGAINSAVRVKATGGAVQSLGEARERKSAARRRRPALLWGGAVAAAAAVGLGIVAGQLSFGDSSDSQTFAIAEEAGAAQSSPAGAMPVSTPVESMAAATAADETDWGASEGAEQPARARAEVSPDDYASREAEAFGGAATPSPSANAAPAPRRAASTRAAPMTTTPEGSTGSSSSGMLAGRDDFLADLDVERARRGGRAPSNPAPTGRAQRADVLIAFRRAESAVQRCLGASQQVARVRVGVDHTGRVRTFALDAPLSGNAVGRCVERAVREVTFPAGPYQTGHAYRPARAIGTESSRPPAVGRARRRHRARMPAEADLLYESEPAPGN